MIALRYFKKIFIYFEDCNCVDCTFLFKILPVQGRLLTVLFCCFGT